MNDVFILGAGFSRAISDSMPVLKDLNVEVRKRFPEIDNAVSMFPDNIEIWLTYLSQRHPWLSEATNARNHALLLDLSEGIQTILTERMREPLEKLCPDWFSELTTLWNANRSTVLTLNYDTLVERCVCERTKLKFSAATIGYGAKDAICAGLYPIPLTPTWQRSASLRYQGKDWPALLSLYKLHGSINWFYSGFPEASNEELFFVPVGDWSFDEQKELRSKRTHLDKIPFIVPPLTDKLAFFKHTMIRSLWAQAGMALRNAERVFCLGYSLPETDMTMRFFLQSNAPPASIRFYLVNKSSASDPNLYERFRLLSPKRYIIDDKYILEDGPIQKMVEDLGHK